jgi:lantibiotic biosynthesis protein
VSVRDHRVVLRSRRLGVEVLPRLSAAHNYGSPRSWKLYKFLCLLQHQGTCPDVFFDWGTAGKASFLPRITLGNIVVSLACWRINRETALELAQGRLQVLEWRQTNHVPRFAFIAELDHQLLIDFENPLAVETFLELIRKQPETIMVEMFPGPDALAVRGPEGSFVHEIILPVVRTKPRAAATSTTASPDTSSSLREGGPAQADLTASGDRAGFSLEPESEWLFAKLYCSPSHADRLLLELVQPLAGEITTAGAADRWFFVRYADPGWHLRLRFHGDPAALSEVVLPALTRMAEPFQRKGVLWRMQLDRYEPEVERYGGPHSIAIAELLFQLGSELCLDLLPLVLSDAGANLRWKLAFCAADCLLAGLGLNAGEKKVLTEHMRASREETWIVDEAYRRQMARRFRSVQGREMLVAMLKQLGDDSRSDPESGLLPAKAVYALQSFSNRAQVIRRQWQDLQQAGQLTATIQEMAGSLVHMHVNRMLRSCHHEQETVLYDFLVRTYATKLARDE